MLFKKNCKKKATQHKKQELMASFETKQEGVVGDFKEMLLFSNETLDFNTRPELLLDDEPLNLTDNENGDLFDNGVSWRDAYSPSEYSGSHVPGLMTNDLSPMHMPLASPFTAPMEELSISRSPNAPPIDSFSFPLDRSPFMTPFDSAPIITTTMAGGDCYYEQSVAGDDRHNNSLLSVQPNTPWTKDGLLRRQSAVELTENGYKGQVVTVPSPFIRTIPSPMASPFMTASNSPMAGSVYNSPFAAPLNNSLDSSETANALSINSITDFLVPPGSSYGVRSRSVSDSQSLGMAAFDASGSIEKHLQQNGLLPSLDFNTFHDQQMMFSDSSSSSNMFNIDPVSVEGFSNELSRNLPQGVYEKVPSGKFWNTLKSDAVTLYQCPYPECKKTFTRPYNLKSHYRSHTGERPFACDVCGQGFARKHDLKRHQKLHVGQKPHHCPSCKRPFARTDALKRHLKPNELGSPSPCAVRLQVFVNAAKGQFPTTNTAKLQSDPLYNELMHKASTGELEEFLKDEHDYYNKLF